MNKFWEVIYDDENRSMEVIGTSVDDTRLTNNVCEMQGAGMRVRCQTPDISVPKDQITVVGYTHENNLYSRLLSEYEMKTRKRLKRW
jgi:hypothetical protein